MTKIIIFNAPPASGKDQLVDYILKGWNHYKTDSYRYAERERFAYPLKKINQIIYTLSDEMVHFLDHNHVEKEKPRFAGKSWRQVNIDLSYDLKEKFGEDYFGSAMVKRIEQFSDKNAEIFLIPDGGFKEEVEPLIKRFGASNVNVVQIVRPNYTFANDSRTYLDCEALGIGCITLRNDGTLDQFLDMGYQLFLDIIGEPK